MPNEAHTIPAEPVRTRTVRAIASAVLALLVCAACNRADKQPAAPASDKPAPTAAAPIERVFVSAEQTGEVIEVDPLTAKVVRRITVGKRPRGMTVSHDGKLLFVAQSGSPRAGPGVDESKLPAPDRAADGIGVVDLASAKLVRSLPGGQDPESLALSHDGKALFIANEETAELSKLDLTEGAITQRVKVGQQPEGVSVHPSGAFVYVTCEEDNEIVAVDAAAGSVLAHIPVGKRPRAIGWSLDGQLAFVTNELDASLSVIDTRTHTALQRIELAQPGAAAGAEQRPMGIVRSQDGKRFFVSTGRGGAVAEIDADQKKLTRFIQAVGARPWGIALSPDGKRLYTANGPSNDLTIIDLSSGAQKHVAVGGSPWGVVAIDSTSKPAASTR
ncbi:MAG TPA: beta-propeller fold lactonase family protein [Polyangiales bacterium]|jgi:YVTN family beta-propeller protein|nr:beta-propeller fold lactonase family protein [Polyangiales bacterium]